MPKKAARGGVQRHKPKTQKSVQLVRPVSVKEEEIEEITSEEETQGAVATQTAETESETENFPTLAEEPVEELVTPVTKKAATSEAEKEVMVPVAKKGTSSASEKEVKGPATKKVAASVTEKEVIVEEEKPAAKAVTGRAAARRQTGQRAQPRAASSLISPEHFAYVRKDLIF